VGAGGGGVEELAKYLSDAEVLWAMLRFELGSGSFMRSKVVLVHFNGEDCPAVKRARSNSLINEVKNALRSSNDGDNFHACIELKRADEVTAENVLAIVSEYFIIDHVGEFSSAWSIKEYYNQLASERRAAEERERSKIEDGTEQEGKGGSKNENSSSCSPVRKKPKPGAAASKADGRAGTFWQCKGAESLTTGRGALQSLADGGVWNWVLVGPDAKELPLIGGGSGSVDEMRACAQKHDDLVMFGLLRLDFGVGRLKRTKHAFMHLIGPQVPTVKRGRINAVRPSVEAALKQFANCTVAFHDLGAEDLDLESVIERVRQCSIVDEDVVAADGGTSSSIFSVEAFRQALAQVQGAQGAGMGAGGPEAEAEAEEDGAEDEQDAGPRRRLSSAFEAEVAAQVPSADRPPNAGLEVEDTLRLVRRECTCNWALFRIVAAEAKAATAPPSSPCKRAQRVPSADYSADEADGKSAAPFCPSSPAPSTASTAPSERDGYTSKTFDGLIDTTPMALRGSIRERARWFELAAVKTES